MIKKLLFFIFNVLLFIPIAAKGIDWNSRIYDFGIIREENGKAKGELWFVNTDSSPTFIKRVIPGCGCTDVSFTKEIIQPGDTAKILFSFNPTGRPGKFEKNIRVMIGDDEERTVLKIKGEVIPTENTLEFLYPYVYGPLRSNVRKQVAGEIKKGSRRHIYVSLYNSSSDTLTPVIVTSSETLKGELHPQRIAPNEKVMLTLTLNTSEEENYGEKVYNVILQNVPFTDETSDQVFFTVEVVLLPDPLSADGEKYDKGGRAYISPEFIDLGENVGSVPKEFEFYISNEGNENLKVIRIYTAEPAVSLKSEGEEIEPGGKLRITGELDPSQLDVGPFRIKIHVATDDVIHPERTANIVGIKTE